MKNPIFITPAEFETLLELSKNLPLIDSDFINLCTTIITSLTDLFENAESYDYTLFVVFYGNQYLVAYEDDFYINTVTEEEKQKVRKYINLLLERCL